MKKSNAQAELLSQPGRPPRASPANCGFLKQKHLASSVVRYVFHDLFLFIHRLQAQAHSNRGGAHVLHLPPTPYVFNRLQAQAELRPLYVKFFNRLQAQADPGPGRTHTAAEARATVIFLLTTHKILYKRNLERIK